LRHVALILACAACGCAAVGDAGGGAAHLPVSGGGPFRPLEPDPTVADDVLADLDEPMVLSDGDLLALWVTVTRNGATDIEHADALSLEDGFGPLQLQLTADASWEAGSVSGPSVVRGQPWLLFYRAGGAIGWATSSDGHRWTKGPGPTLWANGAEEGTLLGPPAAVRLGDVVRVYYPAGGSLFAAEAPFSALARGVPTGWVRLDGDPSTPARDPMVTGAPFATALGRVTARAAATPAGRLRHDLYFTAATGNMQSPTTCGYAASYTGDAFEVAGAPILPLIPVTRAPTMTPYRDGALLLFVARSGAHDAVAAGLSP
jgi:hypothetical protein